MVLQDVAQDAAHIAIATFVGVAWYNVFELINLIFLTFKRYNGMYFWSMFISSIGVLPYSVGYLMKFFDLTTAIWLPITLLTIGWWTMVSGQSFVLFSRLHLVLRNIRMLRFFRWMIIINVFLFHVPTTVLTFMSNLPSTKTPATVDGYGVMEKVQLTGFCVQEVILSSVYMWETYRMMQLNPDRVNQKTIRQLFVVNLVCILMDIALMIIEFMNFYMYQTTLKATIYSIKLKLEIAVLGRLVNLAHQHVWRSSHFGDGHVPSFVDATKIASSSNHTNPLDHQLSNSPGPKRRSGALEELNIGVR